MEKDIEMKHLICKVPKDVHMQFKIKTMEKGVTMAEVVNKAIQEYLKKH